MCYSVLWQNPTNGFTLFLGRKRKWPLEWSNLCAHLEQDSCSACSFPNAFAAVIVVQSLSRVRLLATPWAAACQAPLSSTISQSLLEFMSFELVMPSCPQGSPGKTTRMGCHASPSGPCFVRTLHYFRSILSGPTWHGSSLH